eukprot:COSAG02_NODE_320_length_24784_cov_30.538708_14_plen_366_part_00
MPSRTRQHMDHTIGLHSNSNTPTSQSPARQYSRKRPRSVAYGTDARTPCEEVLHEERMADGLTVAVVAELACSESARSGSRLRRLRFFVPSRCRQFLDSSEVQSEVRLDPSGRPDNTWLSLPYHRIMAACTCWYHAAGGTQRLGSERVLMVGGGGGCIAHYLRAKLQAAIDVVEAEPSVVRIAQSFFTPPETVRNTLRWHTEDGSHFIAHHAAQSSAFSAVIVDVSHASAGRVDKWDMAAPSPSMVAPEVLSNLAILTRCVLINVLPSGTDKPHCTDEGRAPAHASRCVQQIARSVRAAGFSCVDEVQVDAVSNRVLVCRSESADDRLDEMSSQELLGMDPMKELLGSLKNLHVRRVTLTEEQLI